MLRQNPPTGSQSGSPPSVGAGTELKSLRKIMADIQKEQKSMSESLHLTIDDMEDKISKTLEGQVKN